jgi:hypothetical protein
MALVGKREKRIRRMKPSFVRSAIFAAMVSAFPTYLALYNGLKHGTNWPQAIALTACIAFTISFAVTFFAQVEDGVKADLR